MRELKNITIGIPARNEERSIVRTLNSLISTMNEVPDVTFQIIVLVNASNDNTYSKANEFKKQSDIDIQVIETKTPGKANAINSIKELSSNDILIFCDGDVLFDKMCIKYLVELYKKSKYKVISTVGYPNQRFYLNPIKAKLALKMIEYASREGNVVDGAMYLIEKESLNTLPLNIINDDLYMALSVDYTSIGREKLAITYQEPIGSLKEYYFRRLRIERGDLQLKKIFNDQYNEFRNLSGDKRNRTERKKSLGIKLQVYEKFLFVADIALKIVNKMAKKELLKSKDEEIGMGWDVQSSSKI